MLIVVLMHISMPLLSACVNREFGEMAWCLWERGVAAALCRGFEVIEGFELIEGIERGALAGGSHGFESLESLDYLEKTEATAPKRVKR